MIRHVILDGAQLLDQLGVGELITPSVVAGGSVRPQLKVGIRAEHGGEPGNVKVIHANGLN